MKRLLTAVLSIAMLASLTTGCSSTKTDTSASTGSTGSPIKVGFSFASKETTIYQAFQDDAVAAAKESNPQITYTFTVANADVTKQANDIQDLIAMKPAAIVIMPQDSKAIVSSVQACHSAGIPVIAYNRSETPDATEKTDVFIGLDGVDQAYTTGKSMIELMKKDGVALKLIDVIGDLADENAVNRDIGFKKACAEEGATIVQTVPSAWNPDTALTGLTAALQAHPEATGLFVASDFLMPSVQTALERANKWAPYGKKNHMYFGTQDGAPIGITELENGYCDASTCFDIATMTKDLTDTLIKIHNGQKFNNAQILVKGFLVTPNNIPAAKAQNIWGFNYNQ